MRAKHRIAVLLTRFFFAGALTRRICTLQDRPLCGFVLKLVIGVDELVGFVRPCLAQNRSGEFNTHPPYKPSKLW
jgi:hypothetical protein